MDGKIDSLVLAEEDGSKIYYCFDSGWCPNNNLICPANAVCGEINPGSGNPAIHRFSLPIAAGSLSPFDMILTPNKQTIFVATKNSIYKVDVNTWNVVEWAVDTWDFNYLKDIKITPDSQYLIVNSYIFHFILKIDLGIVQRDGISVTCSQRYTSECTTILAGSRNAYGRSDGTGTNARFYYPTSIDMSPDGLNLIVWDPGGTSAIVPKVRKIVISSGEVTTMTTYPPTISIHNGNAVIRYSPSGNSFFLLPGWMTDFNMYEINLTGTLMNTIPVAGMNSKSVQNVKIANDGALFLATGVGATTEMYKMYPFIYSNSSCA